ncbi:MULTISPECIES: 5'-3' exonuclease H3TH domain-containing protein [Exiguobacterium]|uniref:5'-3' exonuclease n=1 Tax=Exiguobacterium sp. (strain ATCC BAA-1283 / AT1b) TaxID=360911 RepID=C4L0L4_EXISA|nr:MULTISPECIES: 5'-3' exonuclease H3TH domain-containing protein [unclassified Exiguobacterium]ACQ70877.1 5'-3' exonuclease [Exiguobacterium sp. AT1b]
MERKLFLIDGNSMLASAYYGAAASRTKKGREVSKNDRSAVIGMTGLIRTILRRHRPTHFVVVWDVSRETLWRRELYPGYKRRRRQTPPELKAQMELMRQLLEDSGIPQFQVEGYEGEDLIAHIARKFSCSAPVVIMTKDKDLLQLVSPRITVWLQTQELQQMQARCDIRDNRPLPLKRHLEIRPEEIAALYEGLKPKQLSAVKALTGDRSDGIPPVAGLDESQSVQLIKRFGSLDKLYSALSIKGEKRQQVNETIAALTSEEVPRNLRRTRKKAERNMELVRLDVTVPALEHLKLAHLELSLNPKRVEQAYQKRGLRLSFNASQKKTSAR